MPVLNQRRPVNPPNRIYRSARIKYRTLAICMCICFALGAAAGTWITTQISRRAASTSSTPDHGSGGLAQATVRRVVDGDTVTFVYQPTEPIELIVRLLCIDTPERGENGYKEATEALRKLLKDKHVSIISDRTADHDRYGRRLVYLFGDGTNLNVEMVRLGWSSYYTEYGISREYDTAFRSAETEAKKNRLGIWGNGNKPPISP